MTQPAEQRIEWEDARSQLITASDVARLLCMAPADSDEERAAQRSTLIREKAGLIERWPGNETTDLASLLEDSVIAAAGKRLGWDIRPHGQLTVDSSCPRLGATPDSLVFEAGGAFRTCNVKISAALAQEDCKPKKDGSPSGGSFANGCPLYYQMQLLAEMAVTGAHGGILLVLHYSQPKGLKLRYYEVPRNDIVIQRIRKEVDDAWFEVEVLCSGK